MKALIIAAAASVILTLPAAGHGPTRKRTTETMTIAAQPDRVWAAIGNFQDMSWHPAVEKTEGQGGNNPEAKRTLSLKGGGIIDEELSKFDPEQRSYSYRITQVDVKVLPVTNYSSTITITPENSGSKVEWRGAFYRGYPNNDPPPELNDEAAQRAVSGVYRAGLDALKTRLEKGGS